MIQGTWYKDLLTWRLVVSTSPKQGYTELKHRWYVLGCERKKQIRKKETLWKWKVADLQRPEMVCKGLSISTSSMKRFSDHTTSPGLLYPSSRTFHTNSEGINIPHKKPETCPIRWTCWNSQYGKQGNHSCQQFPPSLLQVPARGHPAGKHTHIDYTQNAFLINYRIIFRVK